MGTSATLNASLARGDYHKYIEL